FAEVFVRSRTPFDAGGCGERFESPGTGSPTSEPSAFTIPPAERFSCPTDLFKALLYVGGTIFLVSSENVPQKCLLESSFVS
ncbi:MAG: hypothetical protein IJO82_04080, partial [Clostridia bacterium]|nr:hypothetical protein [Clostridia bacterium]